MPADPASPAVLRDARPDDRLAIAAIVAANEEHETPPAEPDLPYVDQVIARATTIVAEVGNAVAGFAAVVDVGPVRHVTDLFVWPGSQGIGVGRALMDGVRARASGDVWTTFSSADPRALALYLRHGLRPWWPNLYLVTGPTGPTAMAASPSAAFIPADEAAAAERSMTGIDRSADYAFWGARPGGSGIVVREGDGRPIGAGIVADMRRADGRWLTHFVVAPGLPEGLAKESVIAAIGASADGRRLGLCVPGPHPAVPALLEHGFRIFDRDTFCATDRDAVDPVRLVPDASFL